ncbi:glycyl-radical enzyme activating protein [Patescibacteria group bacterium]|nr:glycyl-radical enzyme activating protein [Patescibacteria group bacterium]
MKPLIIDIKGNSLDDGPGIRSVVFFKGCPLDCFWYHNPESKSVQNELWWEKSKCIGCKSCEKACPHGAISPDASPFVTKDLCDLCYTCVEECPAKALDHVGKEMDIETIVKKVLRYKPFFDTSGGGVTASGGEPTMHMKFVSQLFKRFNDEGIHTLLETCGLFDIASFETMLLPHTDSIYFDLKCIDSEKHKKYCGAYNKGILNNFITLKKKSQSEEFSLLPRTPIIPGITDTEDALLALADFYEKHSVHKAAILLNNPIWIEKFEKLGKESTIGAKNPIRKFYDKEKAEEIKHVFSKRGIKIIIG